MNALFAKVSKTPLCNVTVTSSITKQQLLSAPLYYLLPKNVYIAKHNNTQYIYLEDLLWDELQWKIETREHFPEEMQKCIAVNGITLADIQNHIWVRNNFNLTSMVIRSMFIHRMRTVNEQAETNKNK